MSIRTKLFDKGRLVEEQFIRFLIKLDERVSDLEEGGAGGTAYDDTALKDRIKAVEDRVKALEDAQ
jgi:hypothetical protein